MHHRLRIFSTLVLFACGDAGSGTSGEEGSSAGEAGSSSTSGAPTTTAEPTGSGGQTGGQTTGATGDTGAGSSTSASTGPASTSGASSTSGVSDSSGGESSTSGTSTGAAEESTGDTTGDPVGSCLDADFPVAAPLCGDGGPECVLQADELVSDEPKFRNDMPAIALRGDCGPAVLYSVAEGGYFGFYGERTGPDAWAVEPTPMNLATGSLESVPGDDEMIAAVDDGAFGVTVWRRSGGVWQQESALAGMNHTRAPQLVRDGQERLHLGHINEASFMRYDVYDGAWTPQQLLSQTEIHVRIALGPGDAPHLIGWSSEAMTWQLKYVAPPAPSELITNLGSNVLEHHHTALTLVGADAEPWVLLGRKQADQIHHDLFLAHRVGPATWELELVAAEDPGGDEECIEQPSMAGQICAYDYTRLYTTALLASATEVRALYTALHYKGTLIAQCMQFPQPFCFWTPMTDDSNGELRVAWPGAAPDEHQVVADDVFTDRATGRLDTNGAMHLAFYDYSPQGGDPRVRYVRVGP